MTPPDPRTAASHLLLRLRALPTTPVLASAIALLFVVVVLDRISSRDITLAFLYVLPVLAVVWVEGRRFGYAFALAVGLLGITVSLTGNDDLPLAVTLWNGAMRTAFYLLTAWLTAGLRSLVDYTTALSDIDGLTGLFTRRRFYELVESQLRRARQTPRPVALLYLDLDHLKAANDSLGHEGGDEMIRRFAAVLRSCSRETDVQGRLGGDEFAVFLPNTDEAEATAVAQRLQQRLRAEPVEPRLSASIGVAVRDAGSLTEVEALVHAADEAMYTAKNEARGSIRIL